MSGAEVRTSSRPAVSPFATRLRGLLAGPVGLVLALAFPPFDAWWLAPLAVAGLLLLVRGLPARPALIVGLVFGLGFFLLLLRWLTVIGWDAWLGTSAVQALMFAPIGPALALVQRLPGWPAWSAAVWVGEELVRSRVPFGGFPWGRLAFAQADTPLTPWVAQGGSALLTGAVALIGGLLAAAALAGRRRSLRGVAVALLAAVAVPGAARLVPLPVDGRVVTAAVVQGNVPRTGLDAFGQRSAVLRNHADATIRLAEDAAAGRVPSPQLVVLPENATDIDPDADAAARAILQQAVDAVGVPTLVGAVVTNQADPSTVLNQGIVWLPGQGPGERYSKRHPVPFGEYVPFRRVLARWISRFDRIPRDFAAGDAVGVLALGPARIGDVICFEVAYDGVVRDTVLAGADLLVVQTNNATYGRTGQPEQQLAMSRLRAVEHGRTVLVAATSGISAVIAPDGRLVARSPEFQAWTYSGPVTLRTSRTAADSLGAWPEWILGTLGLAAVVLAVAGRRRREEPEAR